MTSLLARLVLLLLLLLLATLGRIDASK